MITVSGTTKALSEMSNDELTVIIANHSHLIRSGRYVNDAHLKYLQDRLEECRLELAVRH